MQHTAVPRGDWQRLAGRSWGPMVHMLLLPLLLLPLLFPPLLPLLLPLLLLSKHPDPTSHPCNFLYAIVKVKHPKLHRRLISACMYRAWARPSVCRRLSPFTVFLCLALQGCMLQPLHKASRTTRHHAHTCFVQFVHRNSRSALTLPRL